MQHNRRDEEHRTDEDTRPGQISPHSPISVLPSAAKTLHPSLAGTPMISNPTRRRFGPFAISSRIRDLPGKGFGASGARRSFPSTKSTGSAVLRKLHRLRTGR